MRIAIAFPVMLGLVLVGCKGTVKCSGNECVDAGQTGGGSGGGTGGGTGGGSGGGSGGGTGGGSTLLGVTTAPASLQLSPGSSGQLTATADFGGSTQDVTAQATWSSSSEAIATVSTAGQVTAVAVGGATITASWQGKQGSTAITVSGGSDLTIATVSPLPGGIATVAYSQTFTAQGGASPYDWAISTGSLPAGLSLDPSGTLSGTPTTAGTSSFTVQVSDSDGAMASKAFSLTIAPASLVITTTSPLPDAQLGTAYSLTLAAGGGASPYTWTLSGTLPAGLTLDGATGILSGTPTAIGSSSFTVTVTDASSATASKPLTLAVDPAALAIVTASPLPGGKVGTAYSLTFAGSGGATPYAWTVSGGNLPAGLTLGTGGALSGAPTAFGTFSFDVQLADATGATVSGSFALTIAPAGLAIVTVSPLPSGQVGVPYATQLAAAGGVPPYAWAKTQGSLPAGLALSSGGLLSGTPTAASNASFTVTVTDSGGSTASAPFNLTVLNATVSGGDNLYCSKGDLAVFGTTDGPANLPTACVYTGLDGTPANVHLDGTAGTVFHVATAGDLTTALAQVQCGDQIELVSGNLYVGHFTLPKLSCDATHWVWLRSDQVDTNGAPKAGSSFPAEGTRATPCEINQASVSAYPSYSCAQPGVRMPTLQSAGASPVFDVAADANHYRLIGLEVRKAPGSDTMIGPAIDFGHGNGSNDTGVDHVVLDRMLVHGEAWDNTLSEALKRKLESSNCVGADNSTYVAVIDSWLYDTFCLGNCVDSHDFGAGTGGKLTQEGPFKLVDNLMATAGESWMLGGGGNFHAPNWGTTAVPRDVEVRRNHSFKPLTWMLPIYAFGQHPIEKNLGEFKTGERALYEGNVFENNWTGWQTDQNGFAFLLTPKNQNNHETVNVNITGTNVVANSGGAFTSDMVGHRFEIDSQSRSDNGKGYTIASVTDATHLALAVAPTGGDGTSVAAAACHPGLCPTCYVQHFTARFNDTKNTHEGVSIASVRSSHCLDEALGISNISMHDLVFDGLTFEMSNANAVDGSVGAFRIGNAYSHASPAVTVHDLEVAHNTMTIKLTQNGNWATQGQSNTGISVLDESDDVNNPANDPPKPFGTYLANMLWHDNLFPGGFFPQHLKGATIKNGALAGLNRQSCPDPTDRGDTPGPCTWQFEKNVIGVGLWPQQFTNCDPNDTSCPAGYPTTNQTCGGTTGDCFVNGSSAFTQLFKNYGSGYEGDYSLASGSPYANQASDLTARTAEQLSGNIGADVVTVTQKTAGVRSATVVPALSVTTSNPPHAKVAAQVAAGLSISVSAPPMYYPYQVQHTGGASGSTVITVSAKNLSPLWTVGQPFAVSGLGGADAVFNSGATPWVATAVITDYNHSGYGAIAFNQNTSDVSLHPVAGSGLAFASTMTRATGSWTTDGVAAGDVLSFSGFPKAANGDNATYVVQAVTTVTNPNDTLLLADPMDLLATGTGTSVTVSRGYYLPLGATAGASPYKYWSLDASSTLPAGLALDSAGYGAIYGAPTTAGTTSNIVLYVVDGAGQRATATLSVTVDP